MKIAHDSRIICEEATEHGVWELLFFLCLSFPLSILGWMFFLLTHHSVFSPNVPSPALAEGLMVSSWGLHRVPLIASFAEYLAALPGLRLSLR